MGRTFSVADAKAHFSDCVRTAEQGRSVIITRRGKPVAALVPAEKLKAIELFLAAGPEAGLGGLAGTFSEEFIELLSRSRRTPPRRVPRLDK